MTDTIKQAAQKFNEEHGRAMDFYNAQEIVAKEQGFDSYHNLSIYYLKNNSLIDDDIIKQTAELYAESVRLWEEQKRIDVETKLAYWIEHWNRLDKMCQQAEADKIEYGNAQYQLGYENGQKFPIRI